MKIISTLLSLVLIFSSGCSAVRVSGKPFYGKGGVEELITYLEQGVGKLNKQDIKAKIKGRSEILANTCSERWIYRYSETKVTSLGFILFTRKFNKKLTKELELKFNKKGILESYRVNEQYIESDEEGQRVTTYSERLSDSIIVGLIGAVVVVAIDYIRNRMKKDDK